MNPNGNESCDLANKSKHNGKNIIATETAESKPKSCCISPKNIILLSIMFSVFILILTIVSIIVVYANNKTVRQRNISRDLYNERTRKFVEESGENLEELFFNITEKNKSGADEK